MLFLFIFQEFFDPVNPDKDTMSTRQVTRKERLDSEFELLQKLAHVMMKANFRELSRDVVDEAMKEHKVREGVVVSRNIFFSSEF